MKADARSASKDGCMGVPGRIGQASERTSDRPESMGTVAPSPRQRPRRLL